MTERALVWFSGFGIIVCLVGATSAAMSQEWFGMAICTLVAFVAAADYKIATLEWLKRHDRS